MSRRARFLAGILTLVALTFSFAESVWASTCEPGMEMTSVPATASEEAPEGRHCGHDRHHEHERDDAGEESPHCPFSSPVAAQLCAGVASLPAPPSAPSTPSSEGFVSIATAEIQHDLLLESMLFRPPRA